MKDPGEPIELSGALSSALGVTLPFESRRPLRFRRAAPNGLVRPQTFIQHRKEMMSQPFGPIRRCTNRSCITRYTVLTDCPNCHNRTLLLGGTAAHLVST